MSDIVIKISNATKDYKIPHERRDTLKEHFVDLFKSPEYENFRAVDNLTLEVPKGEFLGIIGPNGAGKSTILKLVAGIIRPNSGNVTTQGSISPFLELGVGFQLELSGRDNIFLYGALLGFSRKQIEEKYQEIIGFAGLERFIDQKLKNYSSGMLMRLAFAITAKVESDIILIDEVMAVGDESFQNKCFREMERLEAEGKTFIFISHVLSWVRQVCKRVILLDKGKLVADGKTEEIIKLYLDTYKKP